MKEIIKITEAINAMQNRKTTVRPGDAATPALGGSL